jgi:hypothetical protein
MEKFSHRRHLCTKPKGNVTKSTVTPISGAPSAGSSSIVISGAGVSSETAEVARETNNTGTVSVVVPNTSGVSDETNKARCKRAASIRLLMSVSTLIPKITGKRQRVPVTRFTFAEGQLRDHTDQARATKKKQRAHVGVHGVVNATAEAPVTPMETVVDDFPWLTGSQTSGTMQWYEAAQVALAEALVSGQIKRHTRNDSIHSSGSSAVKWAMDMITSTHTTDGIKIGEFRKEVRENRKKVKNVIWLVRVQMRIPAERTLCKALMASHFLKGFHEAPDTDTPVLLPARSTVVKSKEVSKWNRQRQRLQTRLDSQSPDARNRRIKSRVSNKGS